MKLPGDKEPIPNFYPFNPDGNFRPSVMNIVGERLPPLSHGQPWDGIQDLGAWYSCFWYNIGGGYPRRWMEYGGIGQEER